MGSFGGHIVPGVFFILYGVSWSILSLWYHITSGPTRQERSKKCKGCKISNLRDVNLERKSWLPICLCPRFPLEPIIKIVSTVIGILVEEFVSHDIKWNVYNVYTPHGELRDQGKMQHITMYMAFLLSGIVDLMAQCLTVPKHSSKLFLSLAFFIEGLIFATHIGGRDSYNILTHVLLTIVCFMCVLFSLMRLKTSSNLVVNLGFGNCILLQGTWFIQVGYFLFTDFLSRRGGNDSSHDAANHHVLQFMSGAFAWHILIIASCNLILWAFLSCFAQQSLFQSRAENAEEGLDEEKHHLMPGKDIAENSEEVELKTKKLISID